MNVDFLASVQMLFARTLMRHFHVPAKRDLQMMEGRVQVARPYYCVNIRVGLTNIYIYIYQN